MSGREGSSDACHHVILLVMAGGEDDLPSFSIYGVARGFLWLTITVGEETVVQSGGGGGKCRDHMHWTLECEDHMIHSRSCYSSISTACGAMTTSPQTSPLHSNLK